MLGFSQSLCFIEASVWKPKFYTAVHVLDYWALTSFSNTLTMWQGAFLLGKAVFTRMTLLLQKLLLLTPKPVHAGQWGYTLSAFGYPTGILLDVQNDSVIRIIILGLGL